MVIEVDFYGGYNLTGKHQQALMERIYKIHLKYYPDYFEVHRDECLAKGYTHRNTHAFQVIQHFVYALNAKSLVLCLGIDVDYLEEIVVNCFDLIFRKSLSYTLAIGEAINSRIASHFVNGVYIGNCG